MSRSQLILIIGSILLVIAFYFFGSTRKKGEELILMKNEELTQPTSVDIDKIIAKAKSDFSEGQLENLKKLEDGLSQTNDLKKKVEILEQLIEKWDTYQRPEIAINYHFQLAELEPTEINWTAAAEKCFFAFNTNEDSSLHHYFMEKAIDAYKKTIDINPANNDNKINLAVCYTYGETANTMQGVLLLLDVVKSDSNNVKANFLLGKLAMTSGQFEKAVMRFEKVVSLDNQNAEAYLNMAESYQSLGNNKKAIELFEKAKKLVNNPDFIREIDNYITKLKNN